MDLLLVLWNGAFGSAYAFWSATLVRATPLIFVGLSVAMAFRAGILNIGAEGQLLVGAAAATAIAVISGTLPPAIAVTVMIIAGAGAGAFWAGLAAWLRRRFNVLEVISTIMLNFVALALVSWAVRGPLQEPTHIYPQSASIPEVARWPFLIVGQRLHLGFVLSLSLAAGSWFALTRTAAGFRLRIVGAGKRAAVSAGGVVVPRTVFRVFLLSGAYAGLAGASEVGGVTWAMYEGISPGYGYTAIAVALLARLDPRWVVVTGVFFGALEAGAAALQRNADVPAVAVQIVVAITVLGVVAISGFRNRVVSQFVAAHAERP